MSQGSWEEGSPHRPGLAESRQACLSAPPCLPQAVGPACKGPLRYVETGQLRKLEAFSTPQPDSSRFQVSEGPRGVPGHVKETGHFCDTLSDI